MDTSNPYADRHRHANFDTAAHTNLPGDHTGYGYTDADPDGHANGDDRFVLDADRDADQEATPTATDQVPEIIPPTLPPSLTGYTPPSLDSAVLDPANNAVLATLDPVTVDGGAFATNYLKSLTVTANNTTIYSATFPQADQVTDMPWQTTWTPPGNGDFYVGFYG